MIRFSLSSASLPLLPHAPSHGAGNNIRRSFARSFEAVDRTFTPSRKEVDARDISPAFASNSSVKLSSRPLPSCFRTAPKKKGDDQRRSFNPCLRNRAPRRQKSKPIAIQTKLRNGAIPPEIIRPNPSPDAPTKTDPAPDRENHRYNCCSRAAGPGYGFIRFKFRHPETTVTSVGTIRS